MGEWDQVPEVVVHMGVGGYIGWTLLGLLALAVLVIAATAWQAIGGLALIPAGIGTFLYFGSAFHYLRTVEMGWHLPNLAVWAGLLAAGLLASIVAHLIKEQYNIGYGESGSSVVPFAGGAVGTIAASLLDYLNERLAQIPLSWAGVLGLVVLAVLGALVLLSDRR